MNEQRSMDYQDPQKAKSPAERNLGKLGLAWIGLVWAIILVTYVLMLVNPAIASAFFVAGWVTALVSFGVLFVFRRRAVERNKQTDTREPAAPESAPAPQDLIPNQDPATPQDDLSGRD